ncbi:MAG: ClpXP protease specificity-enhancing factor [Cocleimonas sp.]
MTFTSNRSYLLNAIYDWVVDNEATPHVLIFADNPQVQVPQQFVEEGKIILNISPTAAKDLLIDKDGLSFSARFSGKPFSIYAPIGAVLALYASENGEGLSFEPDDTPPPDAPLPRDIKSKTKKPSKRPTLKVVK